MGVIVALLIATAASPAAVRPESVEGRAKNAAFATRASTSSAQAGEEMTPLDAERAFIADAQAIGQWTAFRKWAAPDAIFLPPEPVAEALKDAKDPPKSVEWWPTASFLSCDGKVGANTGGALWPGGRHSYFSTIWVRQPDGSWRFRLDNGDDLAVPRPRPANGPAIRRASCRSTPPPPMPSMVPADLKTGGGGSPDHTLRWGWSAGPDGKTVLEVTLWNGERYESVILDRVEPKPKTP